MNSTSSARCLQLHQRPNKLTIIRNNTPFRGQLGLYSKLQENRNHSPESYIKFKSTLLMHETIRRSLTPVKVLDIRQKTPLKPFSRSKLLPINKEQITKLNFKESGIGDEYAKAISTTFNEFANIKELNVRSNRIADEGVYSLLGSLNRNIMKALDLSNNTLGINSINTLVDMLNSFNSGIEKLSLENTKLTFKGLKLIINALNNNHSLQELNIASNKLGPGCGELLKDFLTQTTTLKKFDLHWNLFKGQEGVLLLEGLQHNDTLKAVDLSWNSLGCEMCTIESLCLLLASDCPIEHFDLSHNRISADSALALSSALKYNRILLGLHLEGNYCAVDHMGFIYPMDQIEVSPSLQKSARIIRTPGRINDNRCWVCNKYVDFMIKWDPDTVHWRTKLLDEYSRKSLKIRQLVYVHLDIDNYEPFLLEPSGAGIQEITRAVPKSKVIRFFFSYRGKSQISRDYPIETLDFPITKSLISSEGDIIEFSIHHVNYITLETKDLYSKPRPDIKNYILELPEPLIMPEWSIEKSIFANYIYDSDVKFI